MEGTVTVEIVKAVSRSRKTTSINVSLVTRSPCAARTGTVARAPSTGAVASIPIGSVARAIRSTRIRTAGIGIAVHRASRITALTLLP
jgi:hypothetical protein